MCNMLKSLGFLAQAMARWLGISPPRENLRLRTHPPPNLSSSFPAAVSGLV